MEGSLIPYDKPKDQTQAFPNNFQGENVEKYSYSPLGGLGIIRLLRLMPNKDENARIQCQLFDYPLRESGEGRHPYEALSYVWGQSGGSHSISIDGRDLPVTTNLHVALLRLRHRLIERIIWVDAICINQGDEGEKEQQIPYMAEIYGKATCVVVWLGQTRDDSNRALEAIRAAAAREPTTPIQNDTNQQAILALLQRPWFRRIWVLQEVAAAHHILILCGPATIDGFAFCLGLQSLQLSFDALPDLRNRIYALTYLMRGSISRPEYTIDPSNAISLHIRPLGDLVEMYHNREATERHDKVFALLGMSSDNPIAAGLAPNYKLPWEELLRQLVKFLLGGQVSVNTWAKMEMAVIKGKGDVLGRVSSVKGNADGEDRQQVTITLKDASGRLAPKEKWTLPTSVKSIRVDDIVCFLQGASKPTIIRPYEDYFVVIAIAVTRLNGIEAGHGSVGWPEQPMIFSQHEFLLVWDWGMTHKKPQEQAYETLIGSRVPTHMDRGEGGKETRLRNVAWIFEALKEHKKATKALRGIVKIYERSLGEEHLCTLAVKVDIAVIFERMGQWNEAEILYEQVIKLGKWMQEADPVTMPSLNNLALIYKRHSDSVKAKELEMMADILQTRGDNERTTEERTIKVARSFDYEVMMLLLDRRGNGVRVTEGVLIAAASNNSVKGGAAIMKLLLDRGGKEIRITEGMLMAAASNIGFKGEDIMWLLLDRGGKEIRITEGVLIAAASNTQHGEELIRLLLDQGGNDIQITEGVLIAAASNSNQLGAEVMKLLLDRRGNKIRITEGVLIAAVSNSNGRWKKTAAIRLLLERNGDEIQITENVVKAAAGNSSYGKYFMRLLLEPRREIKITGGAIVQIARLFDGGVMGRFLAREKSVDRITEEVVNAAAENPRIGMERMRLILDQKKKTWIPSYIEFD